MPDPAPLTSAEARGRAIERLKAEISRRSRLAPTPLAVKRPVGAGVGQAKPRAKGR